jgi:hypothetical protein
MFSVISIVSAVYLLCNSCNKDVFYGTMRTLENEFVHRSEPFWPWWPSLQLFTNQAPRNSPCYCQLPINRVIPCIPQFPVEAIGFLRFVIQVCSVNLADLQDCNNGIP